MNGAQVTAIIDVISQVSTGQIPRETGINVIIQAFGFTKEEAEKIMGKAGKGFVPKPPL